MSHRGLWLVFTSLVACALFLAGPAEAGAFVNLFTIERSKNANVVHYDGKLAGEALDPKEPVVAYWIMKAEDGHREELTFLERRLAFGFEIEPGVQAGTYTLRLAAFKRRPLTLTRAGGRWRAVIIINGKPSYLRRIFAQTEEGGVLPKVLHVDLFGEDETGKPVQERIRND